MEGDAVEGPVVCLGREEVLQALKEMKTGKTTGIFISIFVVDFC